MTKSEIIQMLDDLFEDYEAIVTSAYCQCEPDPTIFNKVKNFLEPIRQQSIEEAEKQTRTCKICGKTLSSKQGLFEHFKVKHFTQDTDIPPCKECIFKSEICGSMRRSINCYESLTKGNIND